MAPGFGHILKTILPVPKPVKMRHSHKKRHHHANAGKNDMKAQ
jgi:hypothetical protein